MNGKVQYSMDLFHFYLPLLKIFLAGKINENMKSGIWKTQKYRKCLSFRSFWGKKTQLEINMKIEIPLPGHCHFVVRWVFKQSTAFLFLFLSSPSITKNQGFVPAGQTLILSKAFHHHHNSHQNQLHHPYNSLAFEENPEQRGKAVRFCVKKSLSMFQFFSFILLSFSLILWSAPGKRWYSGSKAGRILEGVRLEWKRASGGR